MNPTSSVNIIVKATGERNSAQYITTPRGRKRFSVDGVTYSDKQFDKLFKIVPEVDKEHWNNMAEKYGKSKPFPNN